MSVRNFDVENTGTQQRKLTEKRRCVNATLSLNGSRPVFSARYNRIFSINSPIPSSAAKVILQSDHSYTIYRDTIYMITHIL